MTTFEHTSDLASRDLEHRPTSAAALLQYADHCTIRFARSVGDEKGQAKTRELYTKGTNDKAAQTKPIESLCLPEALALDNNSPFVSKRWAFLTVDFTLTTPWYSKDDRPFHVLDNPVRKDRVFGVPFMAAASWKGLLRWACRMKAGLFEHLEKHGSRMQDWNEPGWIVHLFGNERGEGEAFSRGTLQIFPTWFNRIGFEVINPHSREKRAGTQPIVYEVVPAGTHGKLTLLYAPPPGNHAPPETMPKLVQAIEELLTVYGFSAKRTAGWGLAEIWKCWLSLERGSALEKSIAARMGGTYEAPSEAFAKLLDRAGVPIDILLREGALISRTQFKKLGDRKPRTTNQEFESFRKWYETHGEEHQRRLKGDDERGAPTVVKREFNSLQDLRAVLRDGETPQNGGDR